MITLISSVPSKVSPIHENAFYSWKKASVPYLLINANNSEVKTEKDLGFPGDSPLINDLIRCAIPLTQSKMIGLINADILIEDSFLENLNQIITKHGTEIFLTSVRRDSGWDKPINTDEDLSAALHSPWEWHQDGSADLFITSRDLFQKFSQEFPDFILGRLAWDNAIHVYFRAQETPCFNTSETLRIYHQKHGYSHLTGDDFRTLQSNPSRHPSTSHNCHLFGTFMSRMTTSMSDIPRVKSFFPVP